MVAHSENADGLEGRPCRRCGMMIYFAPSEETGNQVPLQMVKNVWYIATGSGNAVRLNFTALSDDGMDASGIQHYVSHFETCPHARSFSKGRKRGESKQ